MADKEERVSTGSVPEHGVVRKRSIRYNQTIRQICLIFNAGLLKVRRKISRDETITEIQFGIYPDEYDKICEKVTSEKHFRNSIEALQERWRMITFMFDDCVEMVKEWDEIHLKRKQERIKQRLYIYLSLTSIIVFPISILLLFICWQLF